MQIQLSQQERKVLEDHKKHEEVCIRKYEQYAEQAGDPQLRSMFYQFADQERQHYRSLDHLLQGRQPTVGDQSGRQQRSGPPDGPAAENRHDGRQQRDSDALMCRDAMMMEKFISDSYDGGIFGSTNPVVRQTLQHIQREEQEHGEGLLNYLQDHGLQG